MQGTLSVKVLTIPISVSFTAIVNYIAVARDCNCYVN